MRRWTFFKRHEILERIYHVFSTFHSFCPVSNRKINIGKELQTVTSFPKLESNAWTFAGSGIGFFFLKYTWENLVSWKVPLPLVTDSRTRLGEDTISGIWFGGVISSWDGSGWFWEDIDLGWDEKAKVIHEEKDIYPYLPQIWSPSEDKSLGK